MESPASTATESPGLAAFLRSHRPRILAEWEKRVRHLPPARGLTHGELLDHLPPLLDRIASMVEDLEAGRPVRDTGPSADQHALERLQEGYDLGQVVREFSALRQCVLRLWAEEGWPSPGTPLLNEAIDEAVSIAVERYTTARERSLVALDRLAAATLDAPDLDHLLNALTRVLLETTAAVDSCAIFLREGGKLVLRAAVGVEEDAAGRLAVEVGSPTCAGAIAATGRPLEMRDASTHPLTSPALRDAGVRGFYGVPMFHRGDLVGVAHISSRVAFEFSKEDKLVFRAMVERATSAIVQRGLNDALELERKKLREHFERAALARRATRDAIRDWDLRADVVMWTDAFRTEYGHADGIQPSSSWTDRIHPDDRERVLRGVRAAIASPGTDRWSDEYRFLRGDGAYAVVMDRGFLLRDEHGTALRMVAAMDEITSRHAAERALRESEERFRALVTASAQIVWTSRAGGEVDEDSPTWRAFTGQTWEEARGLGWLNAVHPDDQPAAREAWARASAARSSYQVEYRLRHVSGEWRWTDARGTPLFAPDGSLRGWVGMNIDITERRRVADELREREAQFRTMADNIAQLAWMADEHGYIFWYNRRWYDYTGTTLEQMQGWGWRKVHHPEHVERVVTKISEHFATGEPWEDTFPLRSRGGTYRWFLSRAVPIRDEKTGRILRWFGTNTDVTENKRIEDERAAAMARETVARAIAERAAAELDALFAGTPIGLALLDTEFRYQKINEKLAELNGAPVSAHLGRPVGDVLPEGAEYLEGLLRQVRDTGQPILGLEYATEPPTASERMREWQLNLYPVRVSDGTLVGIGAAVIEITELKEALRARDEFLSVASHDLRSPLSSMRLVVDLILRRAGQGGEKVDWPWTMRKLEKIRDQIGRISGLLEDLLDVSRIHAGRINLQLAEVDIATLVRDVCSRHLELIANSGSDLHVSVHGHVTGLWDALRLEQVVTNLLTNAAKYGAGKPIDVRLEADDLRVRLIVQDHGVGIAPEDQRKIFERFERVGDKTAFAGTGLGLWIVRRFVEAMGGTIGVASELGQGATFTVELPRRRAAGERPDPAA